MDSLFAVTAVPAKGAYKEMTNFPVRSFLTNLI